MSLKMIIINLPLLYIMYLLIMLYDKECITSWAYTFCFICSCTMVIVLPLILYDISKFIGMSGFIAYSIMYSVGIGLIIGWFCRKLRDKEKYKNKKIQSHDFWSHHPLILAIALWGPMIYFIILTLLLDFC